MTVNVRGIRERETNGEPVVLDWARKENGKKGI
jgi:hypothetical protein